MSELVVEITAEDIAECADPRRGWADPLVVALERLTGQQADVDGGDGTGNIATIGQDDWSIVIDLPGDLNAWLDARWNGEATGDPGRFVLPVPAWIDELFGSGQP